jgi:hypothetical protein
LNVTGWPISCQAHSAAIPAVFRSAAPCSTSRD